MFKSYRWPLAIAAFVVLGAIVGWSLASGPTPEPIFHSDTSADTGSSADTNSDTANDSVDWSHGQDGSSRNADEHWRKHGSEFSGDHSAQDYERDAEHFTQSPPPGTEVKHRADGDTLYYNPGSNTFAVTNSDGAPKTMFKPDRGASYWNHQH
ncbi:MAG TPA: hypothetical protein VIJ62_12035 [Rhizomicrobium sp.]